MVNISTSSKVIPLFGYSVYEFPWGSAVKEVRTGKWLKIFIVSSTVQEIDISNITVILHHNGIEFIKE